MESERDRPYISPAHAAWDRHTFVHHSDWDTCRDCDPKDYWLHGFGCRLFEKCWTCYILTGDEWSRGNPKGGRN